MSNQNKQSPIGDPEFKANWSGHLSQDLTKPINVLRNEIFTKAKEAKNPTWRDFIGDALVFLFENSDATEMLELLVKNNYLDQRGYKDAAKTLGIDQVTAKANYQKLALKE
ncbi:hypothetical protein ACQWTT_001255 [Acinetobacter baumannii]